MRSRTAWLLKRARRQIWFGAAAISLFAVIVAATAGWLARHIPYEFTGDVGQDSVGTVLGIIASSMLAVTTFSLTAMVSAYGSATQLATPRATQLLVSDPTAQRSLSTFLGAFIFAMVGIIGLQTSLYGGQGRVVLLIATVLLIALVVVTLLRWIAHLAGFGRMADVIDRVENAACAAMASFAADPHLGGAAPAAVPDDARPVAATTIGYVTHVDVAAIDEVAVEHGLIVHVEAIAGTLVHPARPLVRVTGAALTDAAQQALIGAFTIERHRSFDHDPRLGLIALSEIASRALAPATNDPGTAIEVLNALLRALSLLPADTGAAVRHPRVHVPRPSIDDLLDDAFLPIVREGVGEGEVALRLLTVLEALRTSLPHADASLRRIAARLRTNVARGQRDEDEVRRFAAAYARFG